MGYEESYSKFYVAPTFRALLEICHRLDLNTCVRRLVTKNGEFRAIIFDAKEITQCHVYEGFVLDGVDYKLLELL